jgi:hypothetical protein
VDYLVHTDKIEHFLFIPFGFGDTELVNFVDHLQIKSGAFAGQLKPFRAILK